MRNVSRRILSYEFSNNLPTVRNKHLILQLVSVHGLKYFLFANENLQNFPD